MVMNNATEARRRTSAAEREMAAMVLVERALDRVGERDVGSGVAVVRGVDVKVDEELDEEEVDEEVDEEEVLGVCRERGNAIKVCWDVPGAFWQLNEEIIYFESSGKETRTGDKGDGDGMIGRRVETHAREDVRSGIDEDGRLVIDDDGDLCRRVLTWYKDDRTALEHERNAGNDCKTQWASCAGDGAIEIVGVFRKLPARYASGQAHILRRGC